jgi:dolichol-phosphate mannosyltransferase
MNLHANIAKLHGPIVVFGAGGFIGANMIRALLNARKDCFAVTHQKYVPWRLVDLPADHLLHADVTDRNSLTTLFERYGFKTIFNFAAFGAYARQDDVDAIYNTNVIGLVNLLDVASAGGFAAFIHSGSSSEYGLNSSAPKENDELIPNSHYAVTKVSAAYLLRYYGTVKKMPVMNLRYYSVYGPYEEPDRLIPKLISYGLNNSYPPLVEPEISRDFVYVDDAVEAAVIAAVHGVKKTAGASVNIATGKKTTIREIVAAMKTICSIAAEPSWTSMQNRHWDLKDWYGDPTLAKQILKWEAKTSLEDGLRKTLAWQKEQLIHPTVKHHAAAPPRISAIIACYKDAQAIPFMHKRLTDAFTQMNVDYEIIFVNDASPDNTDEVVKEITARDNHVVAIEHSRNFGSQSAFLSGMQISTGDAVVLLDGDLQDPPEIIPKFYEKWLEGYEVVYGRRVKRETRKLLAASYKAFYRIFRGMSYIPMPLDAGDFSMVDRKVVNELLALPETDQFLRGLRAWVGFKQTGVDYVRPERMFGVTTNNWFKNIWWAKKAIVSFSFVPLELLSYFGMALTGISFLFGIIQVIAKLLYPDIPHGITTIIVLILFFGGVQILGISILGEYLMKVFEESKRRPKFIRRAIRFSGRHFTSAEAIEKFVRGRFQ